MTNGPKSMQQPGIESPWKSGRHLILERGCRYAERIVARDLITGMAIL
jgi:hypothetical protein